MFIWQLIVTVFHCRISDCMKMRRCSPSSSEGALTSLRPDLPLGRRDGGAPSLDKFLDQIGHRYQIIIMFLLSANSIPIVVNHLLMAFYAVSTPHNCRVSKIFSWYHYIVLIKYLKMYFEFEWINITLMFI